MALRDEAPGLDVSVASVLSQQGVSLELVAVDDGSRDATAARLAAIAAGDPRVKLRRLPESQGLTRALAAGCEIASGRWIARLDAGDRALPGRLARQLAAASGAGVALVSCWTRHAGPGGEPLYEQRGEPGSAQPRGVLALDSRRGVRDGPTHHSSALFPTTLYRDAGGYRDAFFYAQDWDLWFRLLERGAYVCVPAALVEARVSPTGVSGRHRSTQHRYYRLALAAARRRAAGDSEAPALDAARRLPRGGGGAGPAAGLYFVGACLRRNRDPRAGRYLAAALRANPLLLRAWVALALHRLRRD